MIHDLSNESSEISIESIESSQNRQEIEESERIDESSSSKSTALTQDVNLLEIETDDIITNRTFLPRIRPKRHTNQPISVEISNITADDEVSNISSEDEIEEIEEISIESEEESADEFSNIFEDYSSPNYDPNESIDPRSTNNNSYLIWADCESLKILDQVISSQPIIILFIFRRNLKIEKISIFY